MWYYLKHLNQLKTLQCMCTLKQVPNNMLAKNTKLNHRFLEYFLTVNSDQMGPSIKFNNNVTRIKTLQEINNLCNKTGDMSNKEIFQFLTICMLQLPRKVTDIQFYHTSICTLADRINDLTPSELVQLMYMVALKKKCCESTNFINKCLRHLNRKPNIIENFTLTDLLVLCNATFKTSTRIWNKKLLKIIIDSLQKNLVLLEDPGMLITLIKSLRHNECQDEELLATISAVIFFNKTYKYYTFTAISHILALYADYLYYDEELFNLFTECAVKELKQSTVRSKKDYFVNNIRCKDIKRFLWCCSSIGHDLSNEDKLVFEEKINDHLLHGHYDEEPDTLFDSVYYLWMQDFVSEKLLTACKSTISTIRRLPTKTKIRVNILLICMQIEDTKQYVSIGHKAEIFKPDRRKEFERRPHLIRIYNILKLFMNDLDINRLEYEYQVPHINIMGITGYRKNIFKTFAVEVLDHTNSLKNVDNMANGPMKLKMRLLYKMDITIVILNYSAFKEMNNHELEDYIRKEMSIVP